jgi:TRAP-type mannitol/chloroaromatic compound transport system permease small subunit
MVAYYMLGGPYSLQLDSNVRMDLLYGRWSDRKKAWVDAISIFALIFYLGVLLYGAVDSTVYSLEYAERSATAWRPYISPIKIIMVIGIFLMLLQAFAIFFKDLAKARGEEL